MSEQKTCGHNNMNKVIEKHEEDFYSVEGMKYEERVKKYGNTRDVQCPDCNKSLNDMYDDVNDINPNRKVSQQPHGKNTHYCNEHGFVIPTSFGGEDELCPYHQRSHQSEEGTVMMYDEFNQDGEEW